MKKEFDIDEVIKFPSKIKIKKIKKYWILLAPEYPNWIVVDKDEYEMFKLLSNGNTLKETLVEYHNLNCGKKEEEILGILQKLLSKIENSNFYSDVIIEEEESIESVKKNIQINLTNDCNLRCTHCYLAAGINDKKELNLSNLKETLKELTTLVGKSEVVFSGGEPLIYEGVLDILKFTKEMGHKVILFTNGMLITDEIFEEIKDVLDEIQLSMEGVSKEKFELVRGKSTYDSFIKALEIIKKNEIKCTLAITAIENTLEDLEENLIEFINKFNYSNLNIRINDEIERSGNAENYPEKYFELNFEKRERVNNLIVKLRERGFGTHFNTIRNTHFSNCGIGGSIVINSDGKIYPCNEFSIEYGSVEDELKNLIIYFENLNRETGVEKIEKCQECDLKYICNGGCRIKNKIENGSYIIPGCNEKFKEKKYLNMILDYYRGG